MSDKHVVLTGPIRGSVTLPDGTEVNVTDKVIYVDDVETALAVAHEIGLRFEAEGHPDDPAFVYQRPDEPGES